LVFLGGREEDPSVIIGRGEDLHYSKAEWVR